MKKQLLFWVVVWVFLTLLFRASLDGIVVSIYFVTFLLPIVVATSVFFNRFLMPKFLLKGKRNQFVLYFIYMLIVSIYLELLVMVLAFVILADYQFENLGKIAGDIYILTLILYLIVLAEGLILSIRKLKQNTQQIAAMKKELENEKQEEIIIRSNRKLIQVQLKDILFIESLGDYVKVHTENGLHTTKERISFFEHRLPSSFVRIHRSFLVNKIWIIHYNREHVNIGNQELPIGRKYKDQAIAFLGENITV